MFSLYLRDEFEESKMLIGGYDEHAIEMRGTKRNGLTDTDDMSKTDDGIFWM